MRGAIPLLRQYVFMAWCLAKNRDNFTFTFYLYRSLYVYISITAILTQFTNTKPVFVFLISMTMEQSPS